LAKVVQAAIITRGRRITLGKQAMLLMNASIGDFVQIYESDDGRIYIAKIVPPENAKGEHPVAS